MSHELRTPLNAIIGFSELLVDAVVSDPDEVQACLTDILSSGRHLLNLINDVLDISKIEAGRMELNRTTFDLREAVADVARTVAPLVTARAHTLTIDDPQPLMVSADGQRVRQIILNLVSNAIKFTPDGGTITIQCSEFGVRGSRNGIDGDHSEPRTPNSEPAFARVSVTDTGIGIRDEDVPKLFEKFRQLDGSHNRKYEGTGLGLALTKQLVELHGGTVDVVSAFGTGTTFSFTLPLAQAATEASVTCPENALVTAHDA
jgi:signal transduction histidine kinase